MNHFYEHDGLAKTAQILALAKEPTLLNFHSAPNYYRKDLFSGFYLVATLFYKLLPLSPVQAFNTLGVVCGGLFLTLTPRLARRVFGFSEWLTWLALLLMPAYIVIFTYGNETALALTCMAASALCLTASRTFPIIAAGVLFGLAVFSRPDYLFLGPAASLLTIIRNHGLIDWKRSGRRLACFCSSALVFALGYFLVFIGKVPKASLFEHHTNFKLLAAFLLYGAGPANVIFALIGLIICLRRRRWMFMLLLTPILFQSLPYLTRITSPKYVAPAFFLVIVFSVVGMQALQNSARVLGAAIALFFCLFSVTPYGVFGLKKSSIWYLPTDAGAFPTGGYLGFYAKVKGGFFQHRYDMDLEQVSQAMKLIGTGSQATDLAGGIIPQPVCLWTALSNRWDVPHPLFSFQDFYFSKDEEHRRKVMIKSCYLYPFRQRLLCGAETQEKIDSYLQRGRVGALTHEADPFPDVIQIGLSLPEGNDTQLGRRILFINEYWGGEQGIRQASFIKEFGAISCIPRQRFEKERASLPAPLYADGQWVFLPQDVKNAIYYSSRFPTAYSKERIHIKAAPGSS